MIDQKRAEGEVSTASTMIKAAERSHLVRRMQQNNEAREKLPRR